jgi:phosphatidylglycerol:prolipoprotein diacylglycerol transferase
MVEVGPLTFHLYGAVVGLGILVGFWTASRMAQRFSPRSMHLALRSINVWDGVWWVLIPAIVGARIYHVVDYWQFYKENLLLVLAIWKGGLGIFGGLLGGVLGVWVYAKRNNLSFLALLDLAAFGLPIGQAIGRWGNFFNQELYGKPTNLPWGIPVCLVNRPRGFEQFTHFHPLFLYESLWSILVFGLLFLLWKVKGVKIARGSYFTGFLVLYGLGRFFLEDLRTESWVIEGINVAKSLSMLEVLIGGLFLYSKNI